MPSEYHTEVDWHVDLDVGLVQHKWTIKVFDFSARTKTAQESLSIDLPPCPFSDFKSKINGQPRALNGYRQTLGKIVIDFERIKHLLGASTQDVIEIEFKEGGNVISPLAHDFRKVTLSEFKPNLKATWINIEIKMPEIKGRIFKRIVPFFFIIKKEKKRLFDIIDPIGIKTDNIDYWEGRIVHQVNEANFPQTFGIYYRTLGKIHLGSFILGLIVSLMLTISGNYIYYRWMGSG